MRQSSWCNDTCRWNCVMKYTTNQSTRTRMCNKNTNEGRHIPWWGKKFTHCKLVAEALINHQALKMHCKMEVRPPQWRTHYETEVNCEFQAPGCIILTVQDNNIHYLIRRLGGPQSLSRREGETINAYPLQESHPGLQKKDYKAH